MMFQLIPSITFWTTSKFDGLWGSLNLGVGISVRNPLRILAAVLVWGTISLASAVQLQEIQLKPGADGVPQASFKDWTIKLDKANEKVDIVNEKTHASCPSVPASGNVQVRGEAKGEKVLVYGESVTSELYLVDLKKCKSIKIESDLGLSFTATGYTIPVRCDDSIFPNFEVDPETDIGECRSARVFKYDEKSGELVVDSRESQKLTKTQVGVEFVGTARIKDPGKPTAEKAHE